MVLSSTIKNTQIQFLCITLLQQTDVG